MSILRLYQGYILNRKMHLDIKDAKTNEISSFLQVVWRVPHTWASHSSGVECLSALLLTVGSHSIPYPEARLGPSEKTYRLYLRLELSLEEVSKRWGGAPGVCVEGWSGMSYRSTGQSQEFLLVVPESHAGKNVLEVTSDVHIHMVTLAGRSLPLLGLLVTPFFKFFFRSIMLPCLLKLSWDRTLPRAL